MVEADHKTDEALIAQPAWVQWTPFLRSAPPLVRREWTVLGIVALISLFNRFDVAIFSIALKQIQAGLNIPEAQVGVLASMVQLGALPAIFLLLAADKLGRRRLMLVAFVGYTLLTGLTAFAPTTFVFVGLQFLARTFIVTGITLASVIITEEFRPTARGWGIGAFGAVAGYGFALGWLLFSMIEILPFGWRSMYLIGILPMVFFPAIHRNLPETERFQQQQTLGSMFTPLVSLARIYPGRFVVVALVLFAVSFGGQSANFFDSKYLQDAHGWEPGQVSILAFLGGAIAVFGNTLAGAIGDRFGRKRTTCMFATAYPLLLIALYNASGIVLPVLWILTTFALLGTLVSLTTYSSELFPTSFRSTSAGMHSAILTLGSVLALSFEAVLFQQFGSHWTAISLLALTIFVAPVIVMLVFPETSGRRLEEIAPV